MLEQELRQSKQKIKSLNRQVGELDESDVSDKADHVTTVDNEVVPSFHRGT